MNEKKEVVINKKSSSKVVVEDLRLTWLYKKGIFSLFQTAKSAEDFRQTPSGMTVFFNCKAFTLIELLVVVLIIGILAAIALPQYQTAVKKAKFAKLQILAESITKAARVFYLETGTFPQTFDELAVSMPSNMQIINLQKTNSSKQCVKGKDIYCCLTYPQPRYTGAGATCGMNDKSFGISNGFATSSGTIQNSISCYESITMKENICEKFPGARDVTAGGGFLTPDGWAFPYSVWSLKSSF